MQRIVITGLAFLLFTFSSVELSVASKYSSVKKQKEISSIINVSYSAVYAKPAVKSELVTEVLLGDEFKVLKINDEWVYGSIPSQNGYSGWVKKKNIISPLKDSPFFKGFHLVNVRMPEEKLLLKDNSYIDVYAGTRLPLLDINNGYYVVAVPNGLIGYLPADSAIIENEDFGKNVTPEDILDAVDFYESRYKWGGITTSGMDCSGFVYSVFRRNGIFMERNSYMQAKEGMEVPFNNLRTGDLVFFKTKGNRISHVGIYMGQGNFMHSSKKNGVYISSLLEGYYKKRFVKAMRILNSTP